MHQELKLVDAAAAVGAIRFLFFKGAPKAPRWQVVIPALGVVMVAPGLAGRVRVGMATTSEA